MDDIKDELFYTIKAPSQHEIKVKSSRFISESKVIASVDEALTALERIRQRERSATHHCFAYRVGLSDKMILKYSDDGEPSGTAGRPIYDVICGHHLTNTLVVVTRYFGGTKLGTGGLAKAYSEAAKQVLERSGIKECYLTERYRIEIGFSIFDQVTKALHRYEAKQTNADFSDRVSLEVEVRKSRAKELLAEIIALTGGKAKIEKNERT